MFGKEHAPFAALGAPQCSAGWSWVALLLAGPHAVQCCSHTRAGQSPLPPPAASWTALLRPDLGTLALQHQNRNCQEKSGHDI